MRARVLSTAVLTMLLSAPVAASASPAARATPLHASLVRTAERLTIPGSVEIFTTKRTTVPTGDRIVSWTANFGDRTRIVKGTGLPKALTHRYSFGGDYRVTFTVIDAHHRSSTARLLVRAAAPYFAPSPTLAVGRSSGAIGGLEVGDVFTFTPHVAVWNHLSTSVILDFGDGTSTALSSRTGRYPTVQHAYTSSSGFTVTLTARDSHGGTGRATHFLPVGPAPLITFAPAGPAEAGRPLNIGITYQRGGGNPVAIPSCASNGASSVSLGFSGAGRTVVATWPAPGSYTLSCTLPEGSRSPYVASIPVTVAPAAGVHLDDAVGTQGPVEINPPVFTATESLAGHTVTTWTLRQSTLGSVYASGNGDFPNGTGVAFADAGLYAAVLVLTLDDGRTLVSNNAWVDVANPPSVFLNGATAFTATVGTPVTITGVGSTLGLRGTGWSGTELAWDYSGHPDDVEDIDGPPATSFTHTYSAPGSYYVKILVVDDHGGYDDAGVTITVS